MVSDEVMKVVFPLLEGVDLASCMVVCKQWRDLARDDYFWKCLCVKRWPSICKRRNPPTVSYYKLYQSFYKRQHHKPLPPPKISFDNLEFFIDIWAENRLLLSEVVPGFVMEQGTKVFPSGDCKLLQNHLRGSEFKMTIPVEPMFKVLLSQHETVNISVLVGRKDSNKVARLINKSMFDYIDWSLRRALSFEYLDISPAYPFISGIRAWVSLLFVEDGDEGAMDVFGIQLDFCDVANTKDEVLWLLDMLDWK